MLKHIAITEYGQFLGLSHHMLILKAKDGSSREIPLNRVKTISINKTGVSLSSQLIIACAQRGIKVFILDFRGFTIAELSGTHQHAVAKVRKNQHFYNVTQQPAQLSAKIIIAKIKNQRAVLLYFNKYIKTKQADKAELIDKSAKQLESITGKIKLTKWHLHNNWQSELMGFEGAAANLYWQTLKNTQLLPDFNRRIGRGALDISNSALNYGYAILTTIIWHCLQNAGLEIYAGIFHAQRPGKPALVLDIMEEYRAWLVDRAVIKHRKLLENENKLTKKVKQTLIKSIYTSLETKLQHRGKKLKLETIIQRQAYRLAGEFSGQRNYHPITFKW